jgi:hypothetical protein
MPDRIFTDFNGDQVILSANLLMAIITKHPETSAFVEKIGLVLADPDEIRASNYDERCVLYYRYSEDVLDGKWLVVVVKYLEDARYISTFYITDRMKSGAVLWTR